MSAGHPDPATMNNDGRVLLVTPWYRPLKGGVAVVAERLHQGLRRSGTRAELLVLSEDRKPTDDPDHPHVWRFLIPSYVFASLRPKAWLAFLYRAPTALWRLWKFIRQRDVTTVILIYPLDHAWIFVALRRVLGIRIITSLHGGDVKRFPGTSGRTLRLFRAVLNASDVVILCADHLEDHLRRYHPAFSGTLRVIPNAVDTTRFKPPTTEPSSRGAALPPRGNSRMLLHISNFHHVKRVPDIIRGFHQAQTAAGTRLVLLGDGEDRLRCQEMVAELGIADRVEFTGVQEDVIPYLHAADLFILASEAEGAPLVLLEAMACGVPWISTPWGPARDLPSGECGVTVPIGEPRAIARAIEELLCDPVRLDRMARRARELAVERYGLDHYIAEHNRLLSAPQL